MQEIISEMGDFIKAVSKVPTTPDGYHVINPNAARNMAECIVRFAKVFESTEDGLYKYLNSMADRMFVPQREVLFGTQTGDYVVDNRHLGYLDAVVDYCMTNMFQGISKVKAPKIFISHSSQDFEYVKAFVSMLVNIGVRKENLFCSSIPGYNIPLGENIYDYLRNQFEEFNLYAIMMLSKSYYKSTACLNEMGAAWVLKAEYQTVLLPGFNYKQVEGAVDPRKISFTLDHTKDRPSRLTEIKNKVVGLLGLDNTDEIIWEGHKMEFMDKVDSIYNASISRMNRGNA